MITTTNLCPECGQNITLAEVHGSWIATCEKECDVGEGDVPEDALSDWSERAGTRAAPPPSGLASFIVPRHGGMLLVEESEPEPEEFGDFEGASRWSEKNRCSVDCIVATDLATANTLATMGREGYAPLTIYWEPRRAPASITTNLPEEIAL